MLEPKTICEALDAVKDFVTKDGVPFSPGTVASLTRDYLNAAVRAERKAAQRKPKEG